MLAPIYAIYASLNAHIERNGVVQMIEFLTSRWVIGLICICIGLIFGLITVDWKHTDGVIHVKQGNEKDQYLFEFNIPPEQIPKMRQVVFKVQIEQSQNLQGS